MPARYLFLDEVDGYPVDIENDGDPIELAIASTDNFARKKLYIPSTPTKKGTSRIASYFYATDQRKYFVACPHCGTRQVLEMAQLQWPDGKPELAMMICVQCEEPIEEYHKPKMLAEGEWRATAETDNPRWRGYHLSALYSPLGWLSWENIARKFEAASRDNEKMQTFFNTVLWLPWAEEGEVPDHHTLYERRESYRIGTVPWGGLVLTAGVDVQATRLEVEIVAWRQAESWSVDYRVFDGDTSQPEVWDSLTMLLDEEFPTAYGLKTRIEKMAVDSAFNTTKVYNWARKVNSPRVMVVKGDLRTSAILGAASPIEVGPVGNRIRYGIRLWPLNTSIAKEEIYRRLNLRVPNREAGDPYPDGFCHFPEFGLEYFKQLCAEQLVITMHRGVAKAEWQVLYRRNEALDCRVYARAAYAALRPEIWPADRWKQIEENLTARRADEERPQFQKKPKFQAWGMGDEYL